ncbi:hypothetical protein O7622_13185 [Micromonospora sp. WMMD1076]|uniref:hypothetical protein n=1 Tax=Micromonospora sp. WMMD1076 TaxID=3016103 RepID=UPI00249A9157|nr:hypothetical protein [Micromonospora sp. WMMD1076]WFF09432.1 hypothetical protein O7622_13185 [Micromonospora sp. WMMD1076]
MDGPSNEEDYVTFLRKGKDDLVFQIGLDFKVRDYGLSLNPSVSVSRNKVSDLAATFYGLPVGASVLGASLADLFEAEGREGGLLPRWSVFPQDDLGLVADLVVSDLERFGFPFLDAFASLSDIVRHLEHAKKSRFDLGHLAIAFAEMGDFPNAISAIEELASAASGEPPFVAEQADLFVVRFKEHYRLD